MKKHSLARILGLLTVLILIVPPSASAINCDSVPARPPVTLDSLKTFQFGSFGGSDCWGWEAPDGSEYAIMGVQDGIAFVNTTTMQVVGTIPGPTSGCGGIRWRDMVTYRNYCYAVSECTGTNQGLMIIDMQFLPDSLHFVTAYSTGSDVTSHNLSIDTATGFAYVVKSNYSGFRVVGLANPEAPVEFPFVATGDIHDVYARNDTVWVAEGSHGSFSVWNMADKNAAQMITRVSIPNAGYAHNIWPTDDGSHVVTTEETAYKTIKIWDVTDYANVQLVGEFLASSNLAHNAQVFGDNVVMSHYESGVVVFDISTPSCPVEMAQFDTYLPAESPNYNGCWGAFPFTSSGKIYGSNEDGRLFILQSNLSPVNFSASPRVGAAPLSVTFTDVSRKIATGWEWAFGDGDSSSVQTPTHNYTAGGLYDVGLTITSANGGGTRIKNQFITVVADTMAVNDTLVPANASVVWDIYGTNAVPLTAFVLPVNVTNVTSIAFLDSISFVGTRVGYFEKKEIVFDNRFFGQLAYHVVADNGGGSPPLPPGSGLLARVFLRTRNTATAGDTAFLSVQTLGSQPYSTTTLTTSFVPVFEGGTLTIAAPPCDCPDHGDIVTSGTLDAVDLSALIDFIYYSGTQPPQDPTCPHVDRGDFNCDGIDNAVDLTLLIDAVFFGGPGPCDPCACAPYPTNCP